MNKFQKFFYLVEDDDLSSFTTNNKLSVKHIESRIRYSIKYTTTIREGGGIAYSKRDLEKKNNHRIKKCSRWSENDNMYL